jgi:hypothetical protein
MEFYTAIEKNEILSFSGKWMELENIISSEVRFRKTKTSCFLSYVGDRSNINASIIIYTYQYVQNKSGIVRGDSGRRKRRKE